MNMKKKYIAISVALVIGVAVSIASLQLYNRHNQTKDGITTLIVDKDEIQTPQEKNVALVITSQDELQSALQNNKKPAVFFFHMNNCSWCEKVKPIFEQIVENPDFSSIQFYNVDGRSSLATIVIQKMFNQKISGFPTFIFTNDGKYIDKQVGFLEQADFEDAIKNMFLDIK